MVPDSIFALTVPKILMSLIIRVLTGVMTHYTVLSTH